MTLLQDDIARSYILESLKKRQRILNKPMLLIGLPISLITSGYLYAYDFERPYSWLIALAVVPVVYIRLRLLPYQLIFKEKKWEIGDDCIVLKGSPHGRIDGRLLTRWTILPEENLPGYYNLSIAFKNGGAVILLGALSYPIHCVESEMQKRFGEQVAPPNGGKRPSLDSGFPPRRR